MSCCSQSIDEARHERLKALADSINETARMARATVALLLTAALYLGITLLSSTDENLLLNAQVAVLQVGFGMALEQSYIFGPPIFLYLHVQGLFLLSILARKVQEFNDALDRELAGIPDSRRVRQEYWNWLSAFAFVQRFRDGHFHFVQRSLMWISMEAIPLLLLFTVDLSFVRYQSEWITNSHHVVFILDFLFIIWFNSLGFERSLRSLWSNLGRLALAGIMILFLWYEVQPPSFDIKSVEKIALDIENKKNETMLDIPIREIFEGVMVQRRNRIWRLDDEAAFSEKVKNLIKTDIMDEDKWQSESFLNFLCKMIQRDKFLWNFLCEMTQRDKIEIKRDEFRQAVWKAVQKKDISVLDIGPCQWWGLACRYLSVKGLWLVSTRPVDVLIPNDESDEGSSESIQWSSLNELSLADRSLRFSDFRYTRLQGANLEGAELQGANLDRANLRDADLSRAKMDGALLSAAELQDANLSKARLRSANLQRAKLQRATLNGAKLWNANLTNARLQRADFSEAELQSANMKSVYMDIASLYDAKLTCTNLQGARLRGTSFLQANLLRTDLKRVQLQGAKFRSAKLLGTNLEKSQLEGVDFYRAEIRNSFGTPKSLKLVWLHKAKINIDEYPKRFFAKEYEKLEEQLESDIPLLDIPLFWIQGDDLQEGDDLQDCVENIPKNVTSNNWLSKDALSGGEWVVDETHNGNVVVSEFKTDWAEWTVDFACKDEYTGYSSVKRWNSEDPLSGLKKLICPTNSDQEEQCDTLDKMKRYILDKLDHAAKNDHCSGLRTAPDGGRRISDSDWRKVWSEWREGAWKRKREEAWKDDD